MAKKKTLDWQLAPVIQSKGHVRLDQLLAWVSGFLIGTILLLSILDLADFLKDASQHAIGQGSDWAEPGWRQRYLDRELLFLAGFVGLFAFVVYAALNPQRRWTKYALRLTAVVVIGFIAMGYIKWMFTGFDH